MFSRKITSKGIDSSKMIFDMSSDSYYDSFLVKALKILESLKLRLKVWVQSRFLTQERFEINYWLLYVFEHQWILSWDKPENTEILHKVSDLGKNFSVIFGPP